VCVPAQLNQRIPWESVCVCVYLMPPVCFIRFLHFCFLLFIRFLPFARLFFVFLLYTSHVRLCVRFFRFFFGVQRRRQQRSAIREPIAAVTAQFAALSPKKTSYISAHATTAAKPKAAENCVFFGGSTYMCCITLSLFFRCCFIHFLHFFVAFCIRIFWYCPFRSFVYSLSHRPTKKFGGNDERINERPPTHTNIIGNGNMFGLL